jgi:hypothetical protein
VRLLFDDPDLNLRANYTLFERTSGRPMCVGNGGNLPALDLSRDEDLALSVTGSLRLANRGQLQALWPLERADRR